MTRRHVMNSIIILEDEPHAAKHLTQRVEQLNFHVVSVLSQCSDLLLWLDTNVDTPVDIILLDIHVTDGNSFDLFQSGLTLPQVILTTAYPDYAIKAFEANCCDYLLKPFSDERLMQALLKAQERIIHTSKSLLHESGVASKPYSTCQRIFAKRGANTYPIKTDLIAYFYKASLLQLVTSDNEVYIHDVTLEELVHRLNPDKFFRINRQWIVNIDAVIMLKSFQQKKLLLQLSPGTEQAVIVSQDKVKAFKAWLAAGL